MTRIERFTIEILQRAKTASDAVHILTYQLAAQYEIEEKFIRERLEQLHTEKFIRLSAWDGTRDKPIEEWPSADCFFNFSADGNHKRIRLLLRGSEYLEKLPTPEPVSGPTPSIGFTPRFALISPGAPWIQWPTRKVATLLFSDSSLVSISVFPPGRG